jgi:hypothetical protein
MIFCQCLFSWPRDWNGRFQGTGQFNMFKLVREEVTNIVIWLVDIIQGKVTMDGFEWYIATE